MPAAGILSTESKFDATNDEAGGESIVKGAHPGERVVATETKPTVSKDRPEVCDLRHTIAIARRISCSLACVILVAECFSHHGR